MSFQAYLVKIEEKTGLTPRQFIELARERGYDQQEAKAGTTGTHRDESDTLWLDGKATKPGG